MVLRSKKCRIRWQRYSPPIHIKIKKALRKIKSMLTQGTHKFPQKRFSQFGSAVWPEIKYKFMSEEL